MTADRGPMTGHGASVPVFRPRSTLRGGICMDEILTVQEVANYLKVSRSTVWRWCNQGKLFAFKAGHGWRVPRMAVERLVGQLPQEEIITGGVIIMGIGDNP